MSRVSVAGLRRDGVARPDLAQRAVGGLRQEEAPYPASSEGARTGQQHGGLNGTSGRRTSMP